MFEALPSHPDALTFRDRLVRACVETPAMGLVLHSVAGPSVLLATVEGTPLVFLAALESASPETLQAQVRQLLAAVDPGGTLTLVVVSGTSATIRAVRAEAPRLQLRRQRNVLHVTTDGVLTRVAGAGLAGLEDALRRARADPGFEPVDLSALMARQSHALRAERDFAAKLKQSRTFVTYALVCINAAMFAAQLFFGAEMRVLADDRLGALTQGGVLAGEWWRLWASTMLHGSILHLGFNMMALLSFAPLLETVLGRARFFCLYALSGLGGALLSATLHATGYSLGASGAIWGVMTGGAALVLRPQGLLPPLTRALLKRRVWVPIAINIALSFTPGIDLWSHLGGGLAGFLLVVSGLAVAGLSGQGAALAPRREGRGALAVALLLALGMGASVVAASVKGRPWELLAPPPAVEVPLEGTPLVQPVPGGTPLRERPSVGTSSRVFVAGSLLRDPLAIVVTVTPETAVPGDGEDELRARLANTPWENGKRDQDTTLVQRGLQPWAIDAFLQDNGVRAYRGYTLVGYPAGEPLAPMHVLVYVLVHPEAPAAWKALAADLATGTELRR
jgi:rhomboid protease GluP